MALILAIGGFAILVVGYLAEWVIHCRFEKQKDKSEKEDLKENIKAIAHNGDVIRRRSESLDRTKFIMFVCLVAIQYFTITEEWKKRSDIIAKQIKETMSEMASINARLTKIEHYLWGNGGGDQERKDNPQGPSGAEAELQDMKKEFQQAKADANALAAEINKRFQTMEIEIDELRQNAPTHVPSRREPARTH